MYAQTLKIVKERLTKLPRLRNEGPNLFLDGYLGGVGLAKSELEAKEVVEKINALLKQSKLIMINTPVEVDRNPVLQDRLNTVIDHYLARKARHGSPINQELIEIKNDAAGEVFKTWRK